MAVALADVSARRFPAPEDGLEALGVLADALPDVPTAALKRLFASGQVLRAGRACGAGQRLAAGEELSVAAGALARLERVSPAPLPGFAVLYEDPGLLACFKPAGVSVVAERGASERPFLGAVLHHLASRPGRPRLVHRLDRETSGVVLVALDRATLRELGRQFADREVGKEYLALVHGAPREDTGRVELPLAVEQRPRRGRPPVTWGRGKEAATAWEVVERFGRHSLLRACPETGRQHQVRAHLAALGHPLVCDAAYGGRGPLLLSALKRGRYRNKGEERPLLARVALHARRLRFVRAGAPCEVVAPLPADFERALACLRRHDRR